jgi:hypothetical protein|tara:strand:+ start:329 stop:967 length:639 start_codon:yes stop_codon:yes gene_type:complete
MKESTLLAHMCEPKRRWLQKDEKRVTIGFYAFQRFYRLSAGHKKEKTYEDFVKSSFYNAFVKFGSFVNNVRPLYPDKYIDYVVTSNVKLDHWCREAMYEKYAIELICKEGVETALERSINTMVEWAKDKDSTYNHYFLYASTNRITWDIKDGKISPWLVLNCSSGKAALSNFNDEQLSMLGAVLDPSHWALRFKRQPKDVELVKQVAKEANL